MDVNGLKRGSLNNIPAVVMVRLVCQMLTLLSSGQESPLQEVTVFIVLSINCLSYLTNKGIHSIVVRVLPEKEN